MLCDRSVWVSACLSMHGFQKMVNGIRWFFLDFGAWKTWLTFARGPHRRITVLCSDWTSDSPPLQKQLIGPMVPSSASSSAKFSFVLLRLDMHVISVLFTYRILLLDGIVLVEAHFTVLHFAIWVKLVTVIAEKKRDGIVSQRRWGLLSPRSAGTQSSECHAYGMLQSKTCWMTAKMYLHSWEGYKLLLGWRL